MPIAPRESESSPCGELVVQVETEAPKVDHTEAAAEAPVPAPAAEKAENPKPPTSPGGEKWSVRIGEIFDFGEGGRFTVKERLGRGGVGEVYRAEYVAPGANKLVQDVALKVLRPDALARHERTFIDEVRLLSLLRHNHIARYLKFFVDKGRQVLVMEYVDGRSLDSILELARRKGRTLSESTSFELLAQVAEALMYAYAAKDDAGRPLNIVHRDVSPANIIVNSAGFAMLVDFGVAKSDLENRTRTRSDHLNIRGKLPYLSPEQVLNQPLDGRSDLFSLCSVLLEMLTGEPPFGRALNALESTMVVTPSYVDHVTRRLSKKARGICRKALANDPRQRFADGHEMAAAMLANHSYRGPVGVQEEIAELEALPDAPPETERRPVTDLRRVKRKFRALASIGALAFAVWAGFYGWNRTHSRPTAPPQERPMALTVKAEEGKPTVKNEMKSETATPAVAKTAPPAPTGSSVMNKAVKCGAGMALVIGMGCAHTIQTRTEAGPCMDTDAVRREFEGQRIPDVIHVRLDPSNPKGDCTGRASKYDPWVRDEPCPIYQGEEIKMRALGGDSYTRHLENVFVFGPSDTLPGKIDDDKYSLLIGTTRKFDATGKYDSGWGHGPRDLVGRMTALVTEIRRWDGKKVPVCGVLYGVDGKVGVPIFLDPRSGEPFGGEWGSAYVKLFWPKEQ